MARITVEDCLEKIDNQYDLVLLAKERTVQLNAGTPMLVEEDNDKRTIISLREIGDGKISVQELEEDAIKRLRKEPDETEQQEEIEEETNDDFESLYKGQISKSGVAILPSKITGNSAKLNCRGGTSDSRFLGSIPRLELGLRNNTIHMIDERTSISDLKKLLILRLNDRKK